MGETRTGKVRANGLEFAYLEQGSGPLVLCLHGFPDHAHTFDRQLPALAAAGFRAVAPFMRGYAPTEVPANGPFQSAALGHDVAALVDALSPNEPASLFGHDWGAIAAYGAALLAPARIRRLATAAVPYGPQFPQGVFGSYAQIRRSFYIWFFQLPIAEQAVSGGDFAFIENLWRDWSPGFTLPPAEMKALKETFAKPGVLEAAVGYYRHTFNPAFQTPELAELQQQIFLAPIEVSTLYFHGARDGCLGVELVEGMDASFPKGLRKIVLEDAGHFLQLEKPDAVNRALVEFLKA
jgi:pimeloyl-ACP methyl ester carboxylesterase